MKYLTLPLKYLRLLRKRFWVLLRKEAAYLAICVFSIVFGISLSFAGTRVPKDSAWAEFLKGLGPVVLAVGSVELFHEVYVGRKTREQIEILKDLAVNGVYRVCDKKHVDKSGKGELSDTTSLKVLVLGGRWLLDDEDNQKSLDQLLDMARTVQVLIPDPTDPTFQGRYKEDPAYKPGKLADLADRVRRWDELAKKRSSLALRIYGGYPVATLAIYDGYVYFGPVLYKRRNLENLTVIYRRKSEGGEIYEDHFDKLFNDSRTICETYRSKLDTDFPPQP